MNNNSITMESFQYLLKEKLEEQLGGNCSVDTQEIIKNNGVCLQGLIISNKQSNVAPTIYINHLYEKYQDNEMSLEDSVGEVLAIYQHHKIDTHLNMENFTCFEKAKQQIFFKLINTEANRELLETVPHQDIMDLSMVYVYEVNGEQMRNANITIHRKHLEIWGISSEELHDIAMENTPRLHPYHIESLQKVMQELCMAQKEQRELDAEEEDMYNLVMSTRDDCGIYVLSNKNRMFGAACMLYQDILKDFATAVGKDLMILPSSIHEILILPVEDAEDAPHFKECVMDVNQTQLEAEDILSDSVYYYDRISAELTKLI